MFLPHPRVKVSIVGSLRVREVACSASDRQGSNFESCVWGTVSSQSSHHPQEVLLAQFSLYVYKGGLRPDSFHVKLPPLVNFIRVGKFRKKWLSLTKMLCESRKESTICLSRIIASPGGKSSTLYFDPLTTRRCHVPLKWVAHATLRLLGGGGLKRGVDLWRKMELSSVAQTQYSDERERFNVLFCLTCFVACLALSHSDSPLLFSAPLSQTMSVTPGNAQ